MFTKLSILFVLVIVALSEARKLRPQTDYAKLKIDAPRRSLFERQNQNGTIKPFEFEQGKTYVYHYTSNVLNGVPKLADKYAAFEMEGDLVLSSGADNQVTMQLVNITTKNDVSGLIHNTRQVDTPMAIDHDFAKTLAKTVTFVHKNGQVISFKALRDEPQWSLNMKRAILSLFNLNLTPNKVIESVEGHFEGQPIDFQQLTFFGVFEEGVTGICETSYEVKRHEYDNINVLNITKNKNLENCNHDVSYYTNKYYDIIGCKKFCSKEKIEPISGYYPIPLRNGQIIHCPCSKSRKLGSIDQFSNVEYNVTLGGQVPIIDSVYGHGRIALKVGGDKISSLSNVNLTLSRVSNEELIPMQRGKYLEHKSLIAARQPRGHDLPHLDYISSHENSQSPGLFNSVRDSFYSLADLIIVGDVNNEKDATALTYELQFNMGRFNSKLLEDLYYAIAEIKHDQQQPLTPRQAVVRQLYLDILAVTGTNQAAQLIVKLIRQNELNYHESLNVIDSVASSTYMPNQKTINEYHQLCHDNEMIGEKSSLFETICLTAGKLVDTGCWHGIKVESESSTPLDSNNENHNHSDDAIERQRQRDKKLRELKEKRNRMKKRQQRDVNDDNNDNDNELCEREDIEHYVNMTYEKMVNSTTFHAKVTYLETLIAMRQVKTLPYLVKFVNGKLEQCPGYTTDHLLPSGKSECDFLRLIVVNGLKSLAPEFSQHLKAFLLPVYSDSSEDYRIRIEALAVLMRTQLEKHELESIATSINYENNKQLVSMSVSMIKQLARIEDPKMWSIARSAKYVLSFMPRVDFTDDYSHAHWNFHYDDKKDTGLLFSTEILASNISNLPTGFMFNFDRFDSQANQRLIGINIKQKGMERYLRRIMEPQGVITDALLKGDGNRGKRSIEDARQAFASLKHKLGLKTRNVEAVKAVIQTQLFDKIRTLTIDEDSIKQWIDTVSYDIKNIMDSLKDGVDYHYVKVLMPTHSHYVLPNDNGIPTLISHIEPLIISVKLNGARLRLNKGEKLIFPHAFNMSVKIEPTVYYSRVDALETITEGLNRVFGVIIPRLTYITTPMKFSTSYDSRDEIVTISMVPEMKQIIQHEVRPVVQLVPVDTFFDKQTIIEKKELTQLQHPYLFSKRFGHSTFGMGIEINTENESPYFEKIKSHLVGERDALMSLLNKFLNDKNERHIVRVDLQPDENQPSSGFDFKFQYKWHDIDDCQDRCVDPKESKSEKIIERLRLNILRATNSMKNVDNNNNQLEKNLKNEILDEMFETLTLKKRVDNLINETSQHWRWTFEEQGNRIGSKLNRDTIRPAIINQLRLTAATKSIKPKSVRLTTLYVHNQEKRVNLFSFEGLLKSNETVQYSRARGVLTYSGIPTEFIYEPANFENLKGIIHGSLCWNEKCIFNQSNIEVNGLLRRSEERVLGDWNGKDHLFDGFKAQCKIDRESGLTFSFACEKAIEKAAEFNSIKLDIKHQQLPLSLINITDKIDMALKVKYYRNMDYNGVDILNEGGRVTIEADYSNAFKEIPMMNLIIRRQFEETHFKKIVSPITIAPSAIKPAMEQYSRKKNADTCVHMEKAVRTFDNLTFWMPSTKCQYLLAMDCSAREAFAVFVTEHNPSTNTKIVTVLVHGQEIKMMPPQQNNAVEVILNNQLEILHENKPRSFCLQNRCLKVYVRLPNTNNVDPITVVEVENENIKILTDGKSVKVIVGKRYKGKMCGLCGNNDDEVDYEFQGPDNCIYEESKDFIGSYALTGEHCQKRPQPTGSFVCPAGVSKERDLRTTTSSTSDVTTTTYTSTWSTSTTTTTDEDDSSSTPSTDFPQTSTQNYENAENRV